MLKTNVEGKKDVMFGAVLLICINLNSLKPALLEESLPHTLYKYAPLSKVLSLNQFNPEPSIVSLAPLNSKVALTKISLAVILIKKVAFVELLLFAKVGLTNVMFGARVSKDNIAAKILILEKVNPLPESEILLPVLLRYA